MLDKFGINYWAALLVLAPLIVGGLGMVIERLFLKHLYLDKNLRTAADLRFDVDCRRHLPRTVWRVRPELPGPRAAAGRYRPGFHDPAELPRLVVLVSRRLPPGAWYTIERTRLGAICAQGTKTRRWCGLVSDDGLITDVR
jgi:branched-chain amino acid transport system permease protein